MVYVALASDTGVSCCPSCSRFSSVAKMGLFVFVCVMYLVVFDLYIYPSCSGNGIVYFGVWLCGVC